MHTFNRREIASISNWLTLSHGRENHLSCKCNVSLVACQTQNAREVICLFVYLGKSGIFCYAHVEGIFLRNLKRISLLVVDRETSTSASFVPIVYEIIHKLSCGESQSSATLLMLYVKIQIVVIVVSCVKCILTVGVFVSVYMHAYL